MKKKQREISNEEMMELMGLKHTSNSDDDSDKTAIDLAIEKYSREELAAKEAEQPDEPTTDEIAINNLEGVTEVVVDEQPPSPPIQRRVSNKQRKLSLEEYRNTFMRLYKIEDRKLIFISGKLRKMLDKFACKIGEDRMSMSGLLENIVRHHIELYSEDFEHWKGM